MNVEKDLSTGEQVQRAHDLGLSALLGTIYNFGELVRFTLARHFFPSIDQRARISTVDAPYSRKSHYHGIRVDQESLIRFQRRGHC